MVNGNGILVMKTKILLSIILFGVCAYMCDVIYIDSSKSDGVFCRESVVQQCLRAITEDKVDKFSVLKSSWKLKNSNFRKASYFFLKARDMMVMNWCRLKKELLLSPWKQGFEFSQSLSKNTILLTTKRKLLEEASQKLNFSLLWVTCMARVLMITLRGHGILWTRSFKCLTKNPNFPHENFLNF